MTSIQKKVSALALVAMSLIAALYVYATKLLPHAQAPHGASLAQAGCVDESGQDDVYFVGCNGLF